MTMRFGAGLTPRRRLAYNRGNLEIWPPRFHTFPEEKIMSNRCALFGMFLAALAVSIASSSGFAAERQLKQLSEAQIAQLEEVLPEKATVKPRQPRKLLIFWRCEGFFHEDAIAWSNKALEMIGEKTGAYTSVISDDMAMFEPEKLQEFDAVFFNNTSALKFENQAHRQALLDFVRGGKGIVGSHAATDNFYQWPEGAAMMGALFAGHPWYEAPVKLDDPTHPLLRVFEGQGGVTAIPPRRVSRFEGKGSMC